MGLGYTEEGLEYTETGHLEYRWKTPEHNEKGLQEYKWKTLGCTEMILQKALGYMLVAMVRLLSNRSKKTLNRHLK